jgi:hypothetical protein
MGAGEVQYEQVVLAALREVSDALTATSLAQEMTGIEGGQRDSNPRFGLERVGQRGLTGGLPRGLRPAERTGRSQPLVPAASSTIETLSVTVSQPELDAERRQLMSYSISTLLTRNLHDVFGENDPSLRRAAINEIFTEDCVFYEPGGVVYRGRDEIDRVAGAIRATHPDFRYQPITGPEELGNGGRIQWVSGRPGEAPAYAGTDFIIARDGRIAAVYLFFDKLP